MGTLNKIESILSRFKQLLFFGVILGLLIVIQLKNWKINKLQKEVLTKPKVELIYNYQRDTIKISKPIPTEVVKWKDKIVSNTEYISIDLTKEDSATIAHEYLELYENYSNVYVYKDVLKDDSLAFVQLNEKTQYNKIFDREFIYEDRTPIIKITNTVVKQDKTFSIIGGLDASIGPDYNSLSLGAGFVNSSNRVYLFKYDPINKGFGGAVYFPIFNIKK